jgi:hypothetical protein
MIAIYAHQLDGVWPRGLGHEMSSPVETLGSWARNMDVCVYPLSVVLYK